MFNGGNNRPPRSDSWSAFLKDLRKADRLIWLTALAIVLALLAAWLIP